MWWVVSSLKLKICNANRKLFNVILLFCNILDSYSLSSWEREGEGSGGGLGGGSGGGLGRSSEGGSVGGSGGDHGGVVSLTGGRQSLSPSNAFCVTIISE